MTHVSRFLIAAVAALALIFSAPVSAQVTDEAKDLYDAWLKLAERAEAVVDADRASNVSLERLRAEIVSYRQEFLKFRDQNSDRIQTLQSQIAALGPEPESGHEPTDIAKLRIALNEQLDALRVPRIVAEEAYNRANGLTAEIDQIVRNRSARRLLSRGPSPLNPAHWPEALRDISAALEGLWNETRINLRSDTTREQIRNRLPAIVVLSALGLFFLLLGNNLSERLGEYLRRFGGRGTGVWRFAISLFKIILPFAGTVFVVTAVTITGIPGVRGTLLLEAIPAWAGILLVFNWLGDQLYTRRDELALVPTPESRRIEMMLYVDALAVMLIWFQLVHLYDTIENISDASRAVAAYPPVLGAALVLLRIQRVGTKSRKQQDEEGADPARHSGFSGFMQVFRRVAVFLALVAPFLGGLGYINAAEALIYPSILTLALISAILVIQRFFGDLITWLWLKGTESRKESLVVAVLGFVLWLGTLPILALIWGARPSQLAELWSRFLAGFTIGETTISPIGFITFALVFGAGYAITKLVQGGLRQNLLPKTKIDAGGQNAIVAFTGYLGIFLAALVAITSAGLDLSSVAIVAGALSVGIGFGLQTIVSNFVSGIILLIERPIAKGDWIEVAGNSGYVRDISVRSTRIETFDRTDVIIPNSDLVSGTVANYTRGKTIGRVIVSVGVAYGTDTRLVEKILTEIANNHPMVLAHPKPSVVFQGFGADSLDFEIRAILRDVNWKLSVKSDMNHEINARFAEAGIEIPFAQRDVWLRNPETLRPRDEDPDEADPSDLASPKEGGAA